MRLFYTLPLRVRSLFRRKQVEHELDEELRYHFEQRVEQEITRGFSPEEARYMALRAMDGVEQRKEECRDTRRTQLFDQFVQDVRYAARALANNRGFATVTILSIALGIGANTAIFSLLDKLLLESLPVKNPRELVILNPRGPKFGWAESDMSWSYPAYLAVRDRQQLFTGLLAFRTESVNLVVDGATQRAVKTVVSGNYFDVLGVRAFEGRLLTPEDDRVRAGHPVVVLSHGFWQERLGGRPAIVGQTIRLNGFPFTIVGVSEKGFNGLEVGGSVDVFVPMAMLHQVATYEALDARGASILDVYGRLKAGVTREQAVSELQPLYIGQLEQDVAGLGARAPRNDRWRQSKIELLDGHRGTSGMRRALETPLIALMGMTGLVLLIACANIAGLLMARSLARAREISVRLALGASRWRLVRQLVAESLVISALGGLAGLVFASWTINMLIAEMGESAERLKMVMNFVDGRVLGFTFGISVVTGIVFGLLPALHASRCSVALTLKTGATGSRTDGRHLPFRRMLVTTQVALGLVLVTASGLFLRTLENLRNAQTGFRTDNLIQFHINSGLAGYNPERSKALVAQMLEALQALPSVTSVASAVSPVLSNARIGFALQVEGYTHGELERNVGFGNAVSSGYFNTIGNPIIRGRGFTKYDTQTSTRVVVVNEALVKQYFAGREPLGRHIRLSWGLGRRYDYEIVGISKDARLANLREEPQLNFFVPYTQWDVLSQTYFYVRTASSADQLGSAIREVVKRHDANIPIVDYRTVDEQIDRLLRPERLVASLSLAFGLLATGLAAIGLYGVTAFSVARRSREIGIRMALGAERAAVLRMVLREVAWMAGAGIAVGAVVALGLARYVESQLFGVDGRDITTLSFAAAVLTVIAFAAGWLPARRASRVDPMTALRHE